MLYNFPLRFKHLLFLGQEVVLSGVNFKKNKETKNKNKKVGGEIQCSWRQNNKDGLLRLGLVVPWSNYTTGLHFSALPCIDKAIDCEVV